MYFSETQLVSTLDNKYTSFVRNQTILPIFIFNIVGLKMRGDEKIQSYYNFLLYTATNIPFVRTLISSFKRRKRIK